MTPFSIPANVPLIRPSRGPSKIRISEPRYGAISPVSQRVCPILTPGCARS
ncbi:Uncharacterised protein [Mycobacteroides abscessus subsp. abscessus]|nr:Uncharacterised protein [Mycobacteroides abscessus subsp. abscessus]